MSSASVLYDVPGPRALLRNRVLGIAVTVFVLALLAFVIYRLAITGQFTYEKWQAFTYPYVWSQIGLAVLRTLAAFAVAAVGSLVFGFLLAYARLSSIKVIRYPAAAVTEVLRAIPVLIMMMLLYYGFGAVGVGMSSFAAVAIALIAYNGSVLAEVFRAGVESLPKGQGEAGSAIGMRPSQVMNLILMPQAIRSMLPVIIAQLVVALKDTALGFVITYNELLYYMRFLMSQETLGRPIIPAVIVGGAIYIILCALLSWFATWVQKRTSRSPRVKVAEPHHPGNPGDQTTTELMGAQDLPAELQAQLDDDKK
ncbi:MAG TPA: amino acid ABC transporter permease [Candidatus Agrococcus pullicola]|uniref:Amino acid ABC transporter permease n=1 Tax=Candidatus Agrococcus pullicola TaxID=2838429 RepID=A0A9D1YWP4_9MICO|nr:amino acid ABC transporter permease [Candidatus Agrococcus pullicola]